VNADGYDDFLLGEPFYNGDTGRARLYYGNNPLSIPTANATFTGAGFSHHAGKCVSRADDLNKDGIDDILIGAPMFNSGQGKVYGFFGAGGSNALQGNHDLETSGNVTFLGVRDNGFAGTYLAGGADCNADGWDDVMVSAYYDVLSGGEVYLILGGNSHSLSLSTHTIECIQGSNTSFAWQIVVNTPGSMEFNASIFIDGELFITFLFVTQHSLNYSTSLSFLPVGNHTMAIAVTSAIGDPVQDSVNVTVTSNAPPPGFFEIIEPHIIPSLISFGVGIVVFAFINLAVMHRKGKKDVRKKNK